MGKFLTGLLVLVGLIALLAVGGYFALKRPDIAYETLAARYESAASRYIDLPSGVHVHYRDEGDPLAPAVLLIHGFAASLHTWEAWAADLRDEYRVISIDLPGHGLTRAPAGYQASIPAFRDLVEQFAQAYGLQRFAIAGNSMGGNVAWEYALAHPEQLDALILVDASGWPESDAEQTRDPLAFQLLRHPASAAILRDIDTTQLVRQGLERSFADPSMVTDAMVTRYADLSRAPGHRDVLIALTVNRRARDVATPERLAALHVPTLILHGEQDNVIALAHGRQFHDAIGGSEIITYPNAGHIPQEELPADSAMAVREFLYRIHEGSALAVAAQ